MYQIDLSKGKWVNEPDDHLITSSNIQITTMPYTDMWKNTYYNFERSSAHLYLFEVSEPFFSFIIKASFDHKTLYDQSGIVLFDDNNNWMKACVEFFGDKGSCIGSCVTNNLYSDWSSSEPEDNLNEIWFKLNRRSQDFRVEASRNGFDFHEIRVFHRYIDKDTVKIGLIACSPKKSSISTTFSEILLKNGDWPDPI